MLLLFLTMALARPAEPPAQDAAKPPPAAQAPQVAEGADEPDDSPILVVGQLPRCRPRPGDPLDSVDMAPAAAQSRQQVIKRDPATGVLGVFPDDDPVTGPGVWQRAGTRMDRYVFRVPEGAAPLCVGARGEGPSGTGQLRQVLDATPYHGKIVRVTMWAASRDAGRVWFWVASGRRHKPGAPRQADMATQTGNIQFHGTHGWTPVSLEMGPVRCDQEKVSFGALLDGSGDLWIYKPEIQVIDAPSTKESQRECREAERQR